MEIIPLLLLVLVCMALLLGYPVAFTLAGVSLLFAFLGSITGFFDPAIFKSIPIRIFGIINNVTLLAVPLFVFMGTLLERSGVAGQMLSNMAKAFQNIRGGTSISIIIVGALLAASTGIVGATVVTMGLMSLPILIKQGYEKDFSAGLVASTGTLGQIIPPSIALVLLGDVLKGLTPVIFLSTSSNAIVYGTLAIIGHIYPVYYKFKGGKGVATFFGVYIALNFQNSIEGYLFENRLFQNINILLLIFLYFILFKTTRVSAIASLSTVLVSGIILFLQSTSSIDKLLLLIVVLLIFFKHKDNIKRLMQGKENKF